MLSLFRKIQAFLFIAGLTIVCEKFYLYLKKHFREMSHKKTYLPGISTITILNDSSNPGEYLLFVNGEIIAGSNSLDLILKEVNSQIDKLVGHSIHVKVDIVVELF